MRRASDAQRAAARDGRYIGRMKTPLWILVAAASVSALACVTVPEGPGETSGQGTSDVATGVSASSSKASSGGGQGGQGGSDGQGGKP